MFLSLGTFVSSESQLQCADPEETSQKIRSGWLAREPEVSACLCFLSSGITSSCYHDELFYFCSGDHTGVHAWNGKHFCNRAISLGSVHPGNASLTLLCTPVIKFLLKSRLSFVKLKMNEAQASTFLTNPPVVLVKHVPSPPCRFLLYCFS